MPLNDTKTKKYCPLATSLVHRQGYQIRHFEKSIKKRQHTAGNNMLKPIKYNPEYIILQSSQAD